MNTPVLNFKAVIFDMDGTMIDNMMVHHRAWQQKLKTLGLDMTIDEVMRDVHGVNEEIIVRLFGDRFDADQIKQIAWDKEAAYREIYADRVALLPGLNDFLDRLYEAGIPMGIGTAAPAENVDFILDKLKLRSYFGSVVHAGQVTKGKPDPEVYKKVAGELNVALEDCVIFEDSPTGAQAAYNGGASSCILTTTHAKADFENIKGIHYFLENFEPLKVKNDPTTAKGYYLHQSLPSENHLL